MEGKCKYCGWHLPIGDECTITDPRECTDCECFYSCGRGCKMVMDAGIEIDEEFAKQTVLRSEERRNHVCEVEKLRKVVGDLRRVIGKASVMVSDWNATVGADEYEKRCAVQTVLRDEADRVVREAGI